MFAIIRDSCPFSDTTWKFLDFSDEVGVVRPWVQEPKNLDGMLALAVKLSAGVCLVRVDFYNVKDLVYLAS
ncbi:MAG: ATP-grasp fold amidoligase family protein [Nitrospira sp.]|nr:ATP-grasp fold amidoligase family protein [Nitrospira sp.]